MPVYVVLKTNKKDDDSNSMVWVFEDKNLTGSYCDTARLIEKPEVCCVRYVVANNLTNASKKAKEIFPQCKDKSKI